MEAKDVTEMKQNRDSKEYVLEERLDLEELFLIKDQNGNYISSVNGVELPKSIKKESKMKKLFKKLKL